MYCFPPLAQNSCFQWFCNISEDRWTLMCLVIALWLTFSCFWWMSLWKLWNLPVFPGKGLPGAWVASRHEWEVPTLVAWPKAGPGGSGSGCRGSIWYVQYSLGRRWWPWDQGSPSVCYWAQPGRECVKGCLPLVCEMADGVPGTQGLSRPFSWWWRAAPPWRLFRSTPCRAKFCFL